MGEYEAVETVERAAEIIKDMLSFIEASQPKVPQQELQHCQKRYDLLEGIYDQAIDIKKALWRQRSCLTTQPYHHKWRQYAVAPGSDQRLRKCTACGVVELL